MIFYHRVKSHISLSGVQESLSRSNKSALAYMMHNYSDYFKSAFPYFIAFAYLR